MPSPEILDSHLYEDLSLDHRDSIYRAMSFIARHGGPAPVGDEMEILLAHREPALEWLQSLKNPHELLEEYDEFVQTWSPVFLD